MLLYATLLVKRGSPACRARARARAGAIVAPMRPLRVVHAPLHGPSATRREMHDALELRADSVGYTEAYNRIPYLARRPWWRISVGHSETSRRGPGDVPVLVARRNRPVDRWAIKASEAGTPLKFAPERWVTGFAYRHALGVIEHVNHHPNPLVSLSARREARRSMERLEQCLEVSLKLGRLPVVTGDFNQTKNHIGEYSPREVFDRLNLRWWAVGLDWVAWHRSLIPVGRRVIPRVRNGQDHPWLVIDFEGWRD